MFNLAAHVLTAGTATPDRIALAVLGLTGAERWSYARLIRAVQGCGGWLLAQGLGPGDRVLLRLGNTQAAPIAWLGALAAGLVPSLTSALLTQVEVDRMAALLAPSLVLAGPGIAVPEGHRVALADLALWETHPAAPWHMADPERPGYIAFTSGTSGTPMAVVHAHRAILGRAPMHRHWQDLAPADRVLHAGAMAWTYTLGAGLLDPWTVGATAMIPGAGVLPEQVPLLARRHDATILAAVPGLYRRWLRAPLPPLPRLRHALSAGEALPAPIRAGWQAATGTDIHEALGLTECSTFLSGSPARPAPPGTCGYPQPGRRIAVLDDQGRPLPPGEVGVLAVSTADPGLMLGYLGQPAPPGPWFQTGDLVHQDHAGAVHLHGRADQMMNPGGIRVSPAEVEAALQDLPGVTDLGVCEAAVPSGATVILCAYAGDPLPPGTAEAMAAARLARYKCPRAYVHLPALPRGATGKLDRRALARLVAKTLT